MRRLIALTAPLAVVAGLATSVHTPASVLHGVLHLSAPSAPGALEQSSNWSGVAVTGGTYTRVTGSWHVPAVKVTPGNRYAATWVGIGGYSTADLIQAGTAEQISGGKVSYYAWTEILPAPESKISKFTVRPGDAMTVDVRQVSTGSWTITVTDATSGHTATRNLNYASTYQSAEWIHEAPTVGGSQSQLASTSPAVFDHGTVNGATVIGSAGTQHRIQLVGPTYATPSVLDTDHDGFVDADGSKVPAPQPS